MGAASVRGTDAAEGDEAVVRGLLTAYAVAAGFVVWPPLRVLVLGSAPEVFATLVVVGTAVVVVQRPSRLRVVAATVGPLDVALVALALVAAVRAAVLGDVGEVGAALYLLGVAAVVRVLLAPLPEPRRLAIGLDAVVAAAVVHAALITGLWAAEALVDLRPLDALRPPLPYPFLSGVPRGFGLTPTPTAAAVVCTPGCVVLLARVLVQPRRWERLALVVVGVGMGLTLSKSLGGLTAVALALLAATRPRRRRLLVVLAVAAAVATFALTHLTVHPVGTEPANDPWVAPLPGDERILVVGDTQVSATSYLRLKGLALEVGGEAPWVGVGPGRFRTLLAERPGARPADPDWVDFDPHSTTTGTFVELGLLGVAALAAALVSLVQAMRRVLARTGGGVRSRADRLGLAAALGALGIEAVATDMLHDRLLWVLFGLVAALATEGPQPALRAPVAPAAARSGSAST